MKSQLRLQRGSPHKREQGFVIALVAAFMLLVIGAMMALSIDVVTFYTARSEAQLAADSAALAGARALANSGITSNPSGGSVATAQALAQSIAIQVAEQNQVAGAPLTVANIGSPVIGGTDDNPTVTVHVQASAPTFFARMIGTKFVTVTATATAEAYNPSGPVNSLARKGPPVAPICVKPWLLPNLDPTALNAGAANPIFDRTTGAITSAGAALVGQQWPTINPDGLYSLCGGDCSTSIAAPSQGAYYPAAVDAGVTNTGDFPVPTQALPACSNGFAQPYQLAVAGCVPQPISCGAVAIANPASPTINIDTTTYANRDADTIAAVKCLIHDNGAGDSDSVDTATTTPPFQFMAGASNPVVASGKDVMVSNSLVTIPVIDYPGMAVPPTVGNPGVTVIGFVQVFLNPSASTTLPINGPKSPNEEIPATIINLAGCGNLEARQPILGNGASPVAVRLISQ